MFGGKLGEGVVGRRDSLSADREGLAGTSFSGPPGDWGAAASGGGLLSKLRPALGVVPTPTATLCLSRGWDRLGLTCLALEDVVGCCAPCAGDDDDSGPGSTVFSPAGFLPAGSPFWGKVLLEGLSPSPQFLSLSLSGFWREFASLSAVASVRLPLELVSLGLADAASAAEAASVSLALLSEVCVKQQSQ